MISILIIKIVIISLAIIVQPYNVYSHINHEYIRVFVLPAGHQGLPWTSVNSHGAQLSGQTEAQQAQTQNTGQASHHVYCVASDRFLV